jgi:hypothetical protein
MNGASTYLTHETRAKDANQLPESAGLSDLRTDVTAMGNPKRARTNAWAGVRATVQTAR